jgi:hypothetical protein
MNYSTNTLQNIILERLKSANIDIGNLNSKEDLDKVGVKPLPNRGS